ncbi:Rare lipoprotein A precursor [Cronobacter sakazakii]|nr:Rare lipoprotein A precursor [Cronobacter sakazakii]
MRKQWIGVCIAAGLLTACGVNNEGQQQASVAPQQPVCNGPVVEISGAEPRYEQLNPSVNSDYERDGKRYTIVQDLSRFSQAGLAAIYDAEPDSNLTASGEPFDPMQLTAAHPTLPVPSYARITNLANGRMIVVRINDRGPYGNDRVISLSRAAADRLNTSKQHQSTYRPDYCRAGRLALRARHGLYNGRETDVCAAGASGFKRRPRQRLFCPPSLPRRRAIFAR